MYKLKKEFKGQSVVVYTPKNKTIYLDTATEKEMEEAYKIKGNEKFFDVSKTAKKVETKTEPKKEVKIEAKKPVAKK